MAIIELRKALSAVAGRDVTTPAGSEWLCHDITARTGESIGINTVKRLTGVLPREGEGADSIRARSTTLDIIARYLGYADWKELLPVLRPISKSEFASPKGLIDMRFLPKGALVTLRWEPEREIILRHLEGEAYSVESTRNSKLQPYDVVYLSQVMKGYPLLIRAVFRNKDGIGPYTAAQEHGITSIRVK